MTYSPSYVNLENLDITIYWPDDWPDDWDALVGVFFT